MYLKIGGLQSRGIQCVVWKFYRNGDEIQIIFQMFNVNRMLYTVVIISLLPQGFCQNK
jgi:hypothetical protein